MTNRMLRRSMFCAAAVAVPALIAASTPGIFGRANGAGVVRNTGSFVVSDGAAVVFNEVTAFSTDVATSAQVSSADVNGDSVLDLILATGGGRPPEVRVLDGTDPNRVLSSFLLGPTSTFDNITVVAAELSGSAPPELVIAQGGTTPSIRVFSLFGKPVPGFDPILLGAEYASGVSMTAPGACSSSTQCLYIFPLVGTGTFVEVYDLIRGGRLEKISISESDEIAANITHANVVGDSAPELIIGIPGDRARFEVRSLSGTLDRTVSLESTPFALRVFAFPARAGEPPTIMAFADGDTGTPQVFRYLADRDKLTTESVGSFPGTLGLRGAPAGPGTDGVFDLYVGSPFGSGFVAQRLNLDLSPTAIGFFALDNAYNGGVFVASGDVNGDGVADIITGGGPGAPPAVRVYSGAPGSPILQQFLAYDGGFRGGVSVAAGDVNGDGRADIITGAATNSQPHVKVFNGSNGTLIRTLLAPAGSYSGGVNVAVGDVLGDGTPEVLVAPAAPGLAGVVKVYSPTGTELTQFQGLNPTLDGGVQMAVGDLLGDGKDEIILGVRRPEGSRVSIYQYEGSVISLLSTIIPFGETSTDIPSVGYVGPLPGEGNTGAGYYVGNMSTGSFVRLYSPANATLGSATLFQPGGNGVRVGTVRTALPEPFSGEYWQVR